MEQQQNDNSHASAQSRAEGANLTDVLERVASPDDCCRWCKSGWCTKHGTCEHEIETDSGIGCGLAL